jgi:pseudouridine kinase
MNKAKITVIGAANIDLIGYPNNKLIFKDDNVGKLSTVLGGVGRNIAENLARLNFEVEFLSVLADDVYANKVIDSCRDLNISIKHSLFLKQSSSSIFMAVMDIHNDMALGLSSMSIYDTVSDELITNNIDIIKQNDYCILETNMPQNILELVCSKSPNTKYALDAVSGTKALKAKSILRHLYILKCNLIEAELLSEIKMCSEDDYQKLVNHFLDLGVKKVFITLGKDGLIYGDDTGVFREYSEYIKPINTTGAGDSFMAGLLFGELKNYDIHQMAKIAITCAQLTIQHKHTVHPDMSEDLILKLNK